MALACDLSDLPVPSSPFDKLMSSSNYLLYDVELKDLFKDIKHSYDVMRRVYDRFIRRDQLNVAPSVAKYMQVLKDLDKYPYTLYYFVHRDVKICISQFKKRYHVYVANFVPSPDFDEYKYRGDPRFYGDYVNLSDAVPLFERLIHNCLQRVLGVLL